MSKDKQTKAEKIYEYYLNNPNESLRNIGIKFETSHSQVKRVLEKHGVYPRYKMVSQTEPEERDVKEIEFFKDITINIKKFNKTEIILSDLHIPYHDPAILSAALTYSKELNPDYVVYLGDLLDFYQVSSWNTNPKNFDLDYELYLGRNFLQESKDQFGDAKHYFIEGNHEKRLRSYLFSKAKELSSLRALKFNSKEMLDLDNLDIEYIQMQEWMSTYNEPFRIGKLYHLHGHELMRTSAVVYVARNTLLKTLDNVVIGHHHVVQDHIEHGIGKEKLIGAWSVGCLCNLYPDYRPLNNWSHGFAEIHYADDGRFHIINHTLYTVDDNIMIF